MADGSQRILQASPDLARGRRWSIAVWVASILVWVLVGVMRRVRIPLPEGVALDFLPPVHALLNTGAAVCLILAVLAVKGGKILAHRRWMMGALSLSVLFLLCYVCYHFTTEETRYGGEGAMRVLYFTLLISHIVLAGISLPFILLSFVYGWTAQFDRHRRMVRWVFPVWLYVAITGPVVYLLLLPYYA